MGFFQTHTMTLMRSNGEIRSKGLAVQLDDVNIPLNLEVGGYNATDWYDLYSIGWITPVPDRSDYFVVELPAEEKGDQYSVFGNSKGRYTDHIETRLSNFLGKTP